jgi:general secretion pathway protein K
LRLVKGYDAEAVAKLLPHVVALPYRTLLNINTADAALLSAAAEGLSLSDGQNLVEARGDSGYESVAKFQQETVFDGKRIASDQLDIRSDWFLMVSEANIGQGRARLASRIQRGRSGVRVVGRQREFFDPVVPVVSQETEPGR